MTSPFYDLSEEDWAFFEAHGYLGIMCWGGFMLRKPGYKTILVESNAPEIRFIEETEADTLVSMLRGGGDK